MAWRRPGDKPLSEPRMESLLAHICVTWPQWLNKMGSVALSLFVKYIDCWLLTLWVSVVYSSRFISCGHELGPQLQLVITALPKPFEMVIHLPPQCYAENETRCINVCSFTILIHRSVAIRIGNATISPWILQHNSVMLPYGSSIIV